MEKPFTDQHTDCTAVLMRLLNVEPHNILVVEFGSEPHQVAFDSWSHDTMVIDLNATNTQ